MAKLVDRQANPPLRGAHRIATPASQRSPVQAARPAPNRLSADHGPATPPPSATLHPPAPASVPAPPAVPRTLTTMPRELVGTIASELRARDVGALEDALRAPDMHELLWAHIARPVLEVLAPLLPPPPTDFRALLDRGLLSAELAALEPSQRHYLALLLEPVANETLLYRQLVPFNHAVQQVAVLTNRIVSQLLSAFSAPPQATNTSALVETIRHLRANSTLLRWRTEYAGIEPISFSLAQHAVDYATSLAASAESILLVTQNQNADDRELATVRLQRV